jgi:hypothetical protein
MHVLFQISGEEIESDVEEINPKDTNVTSSVPKYHSEEMSDKEKERYCVWQLDLQLPVQSVPITTKVVNSNPIHCEMY